MRITLKLKRNEIQFSVVREDPAIELAIFNRFSIKKPLLIGSGGCTAFAVASHFPYMPVTLIEPNRAQIELITKKTKVLLRASGAEISKSFGIGGQTTAKSSLIEAGNFEALFRKFREFVFEFILDEEALKRLLLTGSSMEWKQVFRHRYWSVAFDLFFSNSILLTMFGPSAIRYGPKESYSRYFQVAIQRGLLRQDRRNNYFLHHIFFGHYIDRRHALPEYLRKLPRHISFDFHQSMAQDFKDYSSFDFVGLSNILDWSSTEELRSLSNRLNTQLQVGSLVLYRQLNNTKNFRKFFSQKFRWLDSETKHFHRTDRSLFYSSIHLGKKVQ